HSHHFRRFHAEGIGHPLRGLFRFFLCQVHPFEDSSRQAFNDLRVIAREVCAERIDIGDQLVGVGGTGEDSGSGNPLRDLGDVRESRVNSGAKSVIMSTVPQRVWTSPAANASRATTGSSMSTISTRKPYFLANTLSAFGFVPRLAAMTGSHPAHTL